MSLLEAQRVQARMAIVDEHIRCENRHDLGRGDGNLRHGRAVR
jgi:hypothetical protein